MTEIPERPSKGNESKEKQLQKNSLVGEEELNITAKANTKPLGEQDKKPKFTGKINDSSSDSSQGECVQPTEPSKNEPANYVNKLPQENKVQPDRKKVPEKITAQYVQHTTYIVGAILFLFLATLISLFCTPDNNNIVKEIEQLANDFQNQTPYSIKKLKSRVLPYIDHKTAPQPFVLLVASTQDDQLTAKCFAKRVAQLLTTASVVINGSKYSDTTSDNAKSDIDNHLRNVFQEGNFPTVAIIHNLDLIPYGTTTLFYAYCDHDNPMYKEAAIIFTITLPENYPINDNELDREGLVEKYLSEDSPWVKDEKFSLDIMGALISRITDTVIVVNKENKESLEKSC